MDNKEIDELIAEIEEDARNCESAIGQVYKVTGLTDLKMKAQHDRLCRSAQALRELKKLKEQGTFEDGLRRAAEIAEERAIIGAGKLSYKATEIHGAILNEANK